MAWAIFKQECNWSRPGSRYSFNAKASEDPQERPRDFIEYCVGKGWAVEAPTPNREQAKAIRQRRNRA